MCTIGAIILDNDNCLLFKNKDFARPDYADRVLSNRDWCGPLGLETFAESGDAPAVYSGLSLGANRHGLLVCDNHVRITGGDAVNYDRLVEVALRDGRDLDSAIGAVETALRRAPAWWGNLVLTDGKEVAAIELRGPECRIERRADRIARTNHQPLFGESESSDGLTCSRPRFDSVSARLAGIDSLTAARELLSSHDDGDSGICNHGARIATVYGYLLRRGPDGTSLQVCRGNPCRSAWHESEVPLGDAWSPAAARRFIEAWPGASAA